MIVNGIVIFLALAATLFLYSFALWFLLNKKITLWKSVKLTCVSQAMNKLFLTGSGYAAVSAALKKDGLLLNESLPALAFFEFFFIVPWLIFGLYFGAAIAIRVPVFLVIVLIVILVFVIVKRNKVQGFLKDVWSYAKHATARLPVIMSLVIVNMMMAVIYYALLFRCFHVSIPLLEIFKIVSVAITVGYLSPAPAGLGFKEGGFIFLLLQQGVLAHQACAIAITDRILLTGFYGVCGVLCVMPVVLALVRKKAAKS